MKLTDIKIGGWIYTKTTKRFFKVIGFNSDNTKAIVNRPNSVIEEFLLIYKDGTFIVTDDTNYNHHNYLVRLIYIPNDKEKLIFLLKHDEAH